jgi:hypothetical protein
MCRAFVYCTLKIALVNVALLLRTLPIDFSGFILHSSRELLKDVTYDAFSMHVCSLPWVPEFKNLIRLRLLV